MKHFYFATAAAAVLSLAACSQKIDINEPAGNPTFEITAAVASDGTKTAVADDWSVTWTEDDALAAVINTQSKIKFTYNGNNKFTTTGFGAEEGTDYTWNLLYCKPYTAFSGIQNGVSQTYINIPAKTNVQAAGDDKAHLGNQPLYGYATTTGTERPTIEMKHLTTVIAVKLTNTGSEDINIKSINVANDAGKYMSGTFYVKCSDGTIQSSGSNYTYSYSNITLTDGKLAGNTTATYYIPSAAFELEAGKNITISIIDNDGETFKVEKTMAAATTFAAGKIKTTNISLSSADFGENITKISDIKSGESCTVQGTVVAKYNRGDIISDESGSVLLYMEKATSYKIGDVLKVTGAVGTFNKGLQFTNTATIESLGTAEVTYPEPVTIDATEAESYIALSSAYCKYASITGTLNISGSFYNIVIDGTTKAQGSVAYPTSTQQTELEKLNGETVTVKGYVFAVSGSKYVNIIMTEMIFNGSKIASVSGETSWEYDNTDARTLTVEGSNLDGKTITVSGNSHFNVAVNGTTLTVTPSAALSETDDAVSETITVAVEGGNSVTVTLTHKKKVSGDVKKYTKVTTAPEDWSGTYLIVFPDNKARSYVTNKDLLSSYDTALTIVDGEIEQTENTIKDEVTIESTDGGYKIKLSDGKYLAAPSGNACSTSATGTVFTFTVAASGIQMNSNGRYLVQNGSYYRMYTSVGSYKLPNLYKLAE